MHEYYFYLRFKTTKSWTFSWSLELMSSRWCSSFLMTLWNIWSMILRLSPKCLVKMPSMAALTWLTHSWVSMLPFTHVVGSVSSILSMLNSPFSSTNCLISDGQVMYIGKLKESTWASLTNPYHENFIIFYREYSWIERLNLKKMP